MACFMPVAVFAAVFIGHFKATASHHCVRCNQAFAQIPQPARQKHDLADMSGITRPLLPGSRLRASVAAPAASRRGAAWRAPAARQHPAGGKVAREVKARFANDKPGAHTRHAGQLMSQELAALLLRTPAHPTSQTPTTAAERQCAAARALCSYAVPLVGSPRNVIRSSPLRRYPSWWAAATAASPPTAPAVIRVVRPPPTDGAKATILSIDGGGMRGVVPGKRAARQGSMRHATTCTNQLCSTAAC